MKYVYVFLTVFVVGLAASSHNTQPWMFKLESNRI